MTTPLSVRYHQTGADYMRATMDEFRRNAPDDDAQNARVTQLYWLYCGVFSVAGACLLVVEIVGWFSPDWRMPEVRWGGIGVGGVIGLWLFGRNLSRRRWQALREAQVEATVRQHFGFTLDVPVSVTIAEDALVFDSPASSTRWRWPAVREIIELDGIDVLRTYQQHQVTIPRSAWEDEQHRDAFLAEIRARRDAAGGHRAAVELYLRNHDLVCAACSYPLRGTTGARCPECGEQVELEEVAVRYAGSLPAPCKSRD